MILHVVALGAPRTPSHITANKSIRWRSHQLRRGAASSTSTLLKIVQAGRGNHRVGDCRDDLGREPDWHLRVPPLPVRPNPSIDLAPNATIVRLVVTEDFNSLPVVLRIMESRNAELLGRHRRVEGLDVRPVDLKQKEGEAQYKEHLDGPDTCPEVDRTEIVMPRRSSLVFDVQVRSNEARGMIQEQANGEVQTAFFKWMTSLKQASKVDHDLGSYTT